MAKNILKVGAVSKDHLYTKVADAMHTYIKANDLKPGDKLPSEREMAELFGTSRSSVREALRVLENQDMVEVMTGRGVFLKEKPDTEGSVFFSLLKSNFRELHELVSSLEESSIPRAIERGTPVQKQQLLLCAQEMLDLCEQEVYDETMDHNFHLKLAELAGNNTIRQIIDKLRTEVFAEYWSYFDYDRSIWLETVPYHMEVARAVLNNNSHKALEAMVNIHKHSRAVFEKARKKPD